MSDESRVWISSRKTRGKTTYHLRWIDFATGKWRSRRAGTDRKVADREAAKMEDQLSEGTYRDVRRILWADFVNDHVTKLAGTSNREVARRTLDEFGVFVGRRFGPKDVTYSMVERFATEIRVKNKPATINKKLRYLRCALNRAVKRGFAGRNPMTPDLFLRVDEVTPRIATDDEEKALLSATKKLYGYRLWALIYFIVNTGARRGEALGLTWDRITLDGDAPQVRFTRTKSHRDRVIPISGDLADVLRKLKAKTLREGGPFVGMLHTVRWAWDRIVRGSGVPHITVHDLRRTFCTKLVRAGVPLPTVQKLLGHATIATTLTYYNLVDDSDMRAGIAKLNSKVVG